MPRNPMLRLESFIGVWNTTGEVLATESGPATTLVATDTYRWLPGKYFIAHDVDARFGDVPTRSMEVIGYERATGKYYARSFDDQGLSESFTVVLRGRRWSIVGKTARFNGGFDAPRNRLTGLWELRSSRGRWQPWINLELARE